MFNDLIKSKKISQTELAKKIGLSQQLVSNWTRGICQPQLEVVPKLAAILGVTIEEVVNCFQLIWKKR